MKTKLALALMTLVGVFGAQAYGASSPDVIVNAAHDYIQSYGWVFPTPTIEVITDDEADALSPGGFTAAALPGTIVFPQDSADAIGELARIVAISNPTLRYWAYMDCADTCIESAVVVLHEMAHEVQWSMGVMGPDDERIEGQAEAVAIDFEPGFIRRLIGRNPTGFHWRPQIADDYRLYVRHWRLASQAATGVNWTKPAARSWRYKQLGVPA